MPEVPHAGEYHGEVFLVGGGNDLLVAHGPAGLYDRRYAGIGFSRG